ncbi:GDP-mannose 4,6-dehydratase [candidate division TA06 bacterium]|nr:GDP-mannose 4,6-dehydratase [candidate division TA06 bacterium]
MKFFITGIEGFVGHYLAQDLLDNGHQVGGSYIDDQAASDLTGKFKLYQVDLRRPEQIDKALKDFCPQVIFHLAAQSSPALSFKIPQLTFEVNLIGTVNLLEAVRGLKEKCRLLLISSCEVYGPTVGDKPLSETGPYNPISPYASSKVFQEMTCLQYFRTYSLETIVARPFPHTGPGQPHSFALPSFARQIAGIEKGNRDAVIRVGNLSARRDISDVRDVVQAYRLLAEKGRPGEVYNVSSGQAVSMEEALKQMLKMSTVSIKTETDPSLLRPADVPLLWGDPSKLKTETGWIPSFLLKDTLESLLDYWRKQD